MTDRAPRFPLTRVVAAGLILGAGGFGVLRATNAEPLPVPPPISVSEPRPDPNAPALPKLDSFPLTVPAVPSAPVAAPPALPVPDLTPTAFPVPALPTVPALPVPDVAPVVPAPPKPTEIVQPAQPVVPMVPVVPTAPEKPEKALRPAPMPLTLIPPVPSVPTPVPDPVPVKEVPKPPRKVGEEVLVPPMPVVDQLPPPRLVTVPVEPKVPAPLAIAPLPSTPGETPMLPIHKLTLSTALGVALAFTPTSATRAEEPKSGELKSVEEALKKEIKDLKDELKKSKDLLGTIDEQVMGRKDGKVMVPSDAGLMTRMEKLEKSIKAIETKVASLDETLSKRTVGSSPSDPAKLGAGLGKVKVVNEFATKISIVVNDKSYPLDPSQTKEIEVPTGSFSYLLVADGSTKTTSAIKEGETVTLRIR